VEVAVEEKEEEDGEEVEEEEEDGEEAALLLPPSPIWFTAGGWQLSRSMCLGGCWWKS